MTTIQKINFIIKQLEKLKKHHSIKRYPIIELEIRLESSIDEIIEDLKNF